MMLFEFQIILYVSLNLLSLYTLNDAINLVLKPKKKCNIGIKILMWIAYLIIGTFTYFGNIAPIFNILIQILLVMVIMTTFQGRIKNKLVIALSWTTFIVISELIIGITYSMFLSISLNQIVIDDVSKLVGSIVSALIILIIVKAFQLYKMKKESFERFSFFDSLQVCIIPTCSIFIIHTFTKLSKYNVSDIQWLVVISLLFMVFINLFFYYLFDRLRKIEKIKYENELLKNQSEYYMELEKHINLTFEKIRTIKHDLSHHLLYLKAKLEDNTESSLNEVGHKINSLIGEVLSDDIKVYTKNLKLNRILNYKLFLAYKNGIDTEVKVSIKENSIIDESSLYIILGNAIDNAVRCFNNGGLLEKKLVIKIFDDNNNLFIKITNPYIGHLNFKNGLPITTKKNRLMHGIGLQSIKKLVEDKNGYFKITTENNIFGLEILLYDEIINE